VPPPESPGWQVPAASWLLDFCPADYRAYAGWRRNPVALAWLATRHIDAQLVAMRQAYREARVRIDTPGEADYYRNGGIMQYVLRSLMS